MLKRILGKIAGVVISIALVYGLLKVTGLWYYVRYAYYYVLSTGLLSKTIGGIKNLIQANY